MAPSPKKKKKVQSKEILSITVPTESHELQPYELH